MDKTKMIAAAVVVVIVVAAVAVVLMKSSNGGDDVQIDSELMVFGNANGDYTIDQKDLDLITDLLSDTETSTASKLEKYPLADANHDGNLTQADADLVRKIINDEPCTVYHYSTCSTGDYVVDTKWPIQAAIMTGAANNCWLMTLAGAADKIYGLTYSASSPPDATLFPRFGKMESIGSSSTAIPIDNASNYISKYGVTAIISDKTASTLSNESQYEEMGVDVIRVGAALVDVNEYCQQLFLIGFLFQTEDECVHFAKWWISLQNEIDSKLDGVAKKKFVACNGTMAADTGRLWISGGPGASDYSDVLAAAGGEWALDDKIYTDYTSGAYLYPSDTWIYNYEIDNVVSIKTNDWYSGTVDKEKKWMESVSIFENLEAYKNGGVCLIAGDAPIPIRIAYAAVALHPDIFTEEWADQIHQEFMDEFTDSGIDLSGLYFMLTYDMVFPTN